MPPEGVEWRPHNDILSYEELATIARAAVDIGVGKIRITGGEPLVRKGVVSFVELLRSMPGVDDVSLTTNGLLLAQHAAALRQAGLCRVNLSIDSLDPARYAEISRGGSLDEALVGLDAAFAAGFSPVKVNVVLLPGVQDEVAAFAELTREREVHVRFIEYMPVDKRGGVERRLVPAADVLERLQQLYELRPSSGPYGHGPARYWRVDSFPGTLGFIAGVSDHFCDTCNRLRLTADGRLRTCLFSGREVPLRPLLDRPAELRAAIAAALEDKCYDRRLEQLANDRTMSQIGG
jgi:cyclic pyranopterin phosphate synthase